MRYKAYLIVICDKETNAILEVTTWSSPEWEQSRCLNVPTYVAYACGGDSYADARDNLLIAISDPRSRYHWLAKHFKDLGELDRLRIRMGEAE